MNKDQFKELYRSERLARTDNFGLKLGKLMRGEIVSNFDNSHIWALRDTIEAAVAPKIRKRQEAWMKLNG
jgi:hypothetical protein